MGDGKTAFLGGLQQPGALDFVALRFQATEHGGICANLCPGGQVERRCKGFGPQRAKVLSAHGMKIHVVGDEPMRLVVVGKNGLELHGRCAGVVREMPAAGVVGAKHEVLAAVVVDVVRVRGTGRQQGVCAGCLDAVEPRLQGGFRLLESVGNKAIVQMHVRIMHALAMFEHVHALGLLTCGHGGMEFVKAGGQGGLGKNLRVHLLACETPAFRPRR